MKKIWKDGSNEAKLTEEKRKKMNELVGLNNISVSKNITLLINSWCAEHIKTLHKEYPNTEWLAYCKVEPLEKGVFIMTDMVFPWQKTTSGDVETTKEWMEWLNKELISRGEKATDWNCVLHSHHHMGCFWSGTDDNARLSLNDGRQLAWAVVSAYKGEEISYKGCINFYKPYNIEIDVEVKNADEENIIEKYGEYLEKVAESEASFYEYLQELNKDYIESITNRPAYSNLLEYLGVDITDELNKNYNELREKIWNPELIEYLKQLEDKAHELAVAEVNTWNVYTDMLVEYGAFCEWSDNLLTQLEQNKEKASTLSSVSSTNQSSIFSETAYPINRYFDDDYDYYHFTAPDYSESEVRGMIWIGINTPMKVGEHNERMAWSNVSWQYLYVEEWADEIYYY